MQKKSISFLIIIIFSIGIIRGQNKELIWSDEFNYTGLPDSTKWSYDVGGGGWGNNEIQFYTKARKENARVENGKLIIEAVKENFNEKQYTSSRLVTKGKGDWLYGRIEVRAKLPKGRGTWPAIWMLSSDWIYGGWPQSGEIDIMEHVGYDPDVIHFSTHCNDYYFKINSQKTAVMKIERSDSIFYNYTLEWSPDKINGYINDSLYFTTTNERRGWEKWPFDKPFHLILNIAVGGFWGAAKGIDENIWPQKMEIDYVRVYKYNTVKDTVKPSEPTMLEALTESKLMKIKWNAAYDNFSVKEYIVFCNNVEVGITTSQKFTLKELNNNTEYKIKVIAKDWAGNLSKPVESSFKTTE
jgi:beta-glucanase (GH16 family)